MKADLAARIYVLVEKIQQCSSYEMYIDLLRQLDVIENRIDCMETYRQMKNSGEQLLRYRRNRCAQQRSLLITKR